jgi:hypothetical protein
MKSDMPFIVQWSDGPVDKRLTWWLKGVLPNRYVGEITDWAAKQQIGLEGFFAAEDIATVRQLIQDIQSRPAAPGKTDGYALLALGTRSKPDILFRYSAGSEAVDETAQLFLRIVEILRRYVEPNLKSAMSA